MKLIKELWHYREMIISLVKRDLKGRYKGSVMGFLWTMINPLLQLAVYTFVFSVIMPSGVERFYLFLFVALVPWLFFSTCAVNWYYSHICSTGNGKKDLFPKADIANIFYYKPVRKYVVKLCSHIYCTDFQWN